jgi:CRP-like cAMP-binding protein
VSALGLNGALLVMAFVPAALALLGYPSLAALDRAARARVAELAPRVAVLEGLGIFAAAPPAVLERLAADSTEVAFPAGTVIVREGEAADALYVLIDGVADVTARGEADAHGERAVRSMTAGSYFGEIGLLEGIPRTATVTAVQDCRCYRIDGDAFVQALTATPPAPTLVEGARSRLALTHPSRRLTYEPAAVDG